MVSILAILIYLKAVFLLKFLLKTCTAVFALSCCYANADSLVSANEDPELEPVHYAFANYLGSGIYRTSNQKVTLINLPFSYDFESKGKFEYSLRLPVSIGFFNFDFSDIPDFKLPDRIGTLTFTPGINIGYHLTEDIFIEGYADIGVARNTTTEQDVSVSSFGFSASYFFDVDDYDAMWINRVYTANYNGINNDAYDSYSALQTGLDVGLPSSIDVLGYSLQPRFFASAFWYFNDLDLFAGHNSRTKVEHNSNYQVSLTDSYEVGVRFKFNKVVGWQGAGITTLGVGYRFTQDFSAIRLLFSTPI